MDITAILEHLVAFVGGGAVVSIFKIISERQKRKSDAESVDADTDIKQYDSWKQAYHDLDEHFQKMSIKLVELHLQYTELSIKQMENEQIINELKQENSELKEELNKLKK